MPLLVIRALPQQDSSLIKPALKKTCEAIADVCRCPVVQVRVTWEEIRPGWYVEGGISVPMQPASSHPPLCQLICFEGKSQVEIEEILLVTAKTLCEALNIKDNIFITYHETKAGRVISGNGFTRK